MAQTGFAENDWKSLYRIGGLSALICAAMYLLASAVYIPANLAGPPPGNVLEWFTLFQDHALSGLFFLGLADIAIMLLWGPLSLALYTLLKQANRTWTLIATGFVFVGMAVFLSTNTAFPMLSLSRQYAAAITEAEKSALLAAGRALIAINEGNYWGMPLVWLGGLILSVVMLRSTVFGKAAAWVGILGMALLLLSVPFAGYTTTGPMTAAVSAIVAISYAGGGLLSLAWYILIGMRLVRLGQLAELVERPT